jgi:NTP pyrophosphatase (non-canonical NTP hydrolase)
VILKAKSTKLPIGAWESRARPGIKKTFFHNNDQKQGIRENIGDTMWYLAMICNFFGWDFEEVLGENIAKLKARYPQGFAEKDAQRGGTRIDWNEK